MKITQRIRIDLARRTAPPVVEAVQGDSARWIEMELLADGRAWDIPRDACVMMQYSNIVGEGDTYTTMEDGTCAWSISKNILSVALTEGVCVQSGDTKLQVTIWKGHQKVSTFAVTVRVQKGVEAISIPKRPVRRECYVTPQMFGAVGDGVKDDTDAIRAARNAAVTERKALYFPAGTYLVHGCIELWTDCEIYGEGSKTVIRKIPAVTTVIKAEGEHGSFVEGQAVFEVPDGSKYKVGQDFYVGINAGNAEGMRGWVKGVNGNAVTVVEYPTVCDDDGAIVHGLSGKLLQTLNDEQASVVFSTTFPVFCTMRYSVNGQWNAVENVHIHDLTIDGQRQYTEPKSHTVSAIYFESMNVIQIDDMERIAALPHKNVQIERVDILNSPADGICVHSARNVSITGCITEGCSFNGVQFGAGTECGSVVGCKLNADFCGYYDGDGVSAVSLASNHFEGCANGVGGVCQYTRGLSISGNTFRDCGIGVHAGSALMPKSDFADSACYCGTPKHGLTVSNNTFYGVGLTGIGISFTKGTFTTVNGNVFRDLAAALELGETSNAYICNNIIKDCAVVLAMGINPQTREEDGSVTVSSAFVYNMIAADAVGTSAAVLIAHAENMQVKVISR